MGRRPPEGGRPEMPMGVVRTAGLGHASASVTPGAVVPRLVDIRMAVGRVEATSPVATFPHITPANAACHIDGDVRVDLLVLALATRPTGASVGREPRPRLGTAPPVLVVAAMAVRDGLLDLGEIPVGLPPDGRPMALALAHTPPDGEVPVADVALETTEMARHAPSVATFPFLPLVGRGRPCPGRRVRVPRLLTRL